MFAHVGSRAHAIVKVISSRYVHESAHNSDLPHRDKRTMLYRLLTKHNLLHCRQALNHSARALLYGGVATTQRGLEEMIHKARSKWRPS